jgi:hypothetical protein
LKKLLSCAIVILIFGSCVFNNENKTIVVIDKNIQKEVELEILDTIQDKKNYCEQEYMNKMDYTVFSDDTLKDISHFKNTYQPFESYWGKLGDSVNIYGFFGTESEKRTGFEVSFIDKKPKINLAIYPNHIINSKNLSVTKDGEAKNRIKVPSKTAKLTLSEIPDMNSPKMIYGCVEFESNEFYQVIKYENGERVPNKRERLKTQWKIYFKANKCDSLSFF